MFLIIFVYILMILVTIYGFCYEFPLERAIFVAANSFEFTVFMLFFGEID